MDADFKRLIKEKLKVYWNNYKMQDCTLRSMSMRAVIYNAAFFINNSSLAHRVENLPVVLLTDLENLASRFGFPLCSSSTTKFSWWLFVASLLHHRLAKLHLPSTYYLNEDMYVGIANLLDEVGAKCSGLKLIESDMYPDDQMLDVEERDSLLKVAFFRALPKLCNLRVVRIHFFYFDDWALQQIAMHGENIVILKVILAEEVSDVGIQALAKLTHLEQFLFHSCGGSLNYELKYVLLCAWHLPKLRIVGSDFNDLELDSYSEDSDGTFYHSQVVQLPGRLGLEQVLLSGQVITNPCCLLPNLRSVLLFRPVGDVVGLCNRYSTISEFGFYDTNLDTIAAVLQVAGHRLQKLTIANGFDSTQKLPMSKFLQLCPNLKHLQVDCGELDSLDYSWSKGALNCLQTVILNMIYEPLPHDFITKLLGAPLLKEVSICQVYLTKGEVDTLLTSVRQGSTLTNVESFSWDNYYNKNDLLPWVASKKHFKLLLDTIQVTCPKLKQQFT